MQLMVLGMHRSGTSVLARVLNLMGAYFGPEGISSGANRENPKGFWERRDVRALNDSVLHAVNCDWNRISNLDVGSLPEEVVEEFRSRAARLILELDAHRPWFLKEPRLCLLLPLWRNLLELPVCVHIFRHPVEVASSLATRNQMPVSVGLALWEAYVKSALTASKDLPCISVSHRQLMLDPASEVERLYSMLLEHDVPNLRMPTSRELAAFIDPALYRERGTSKDLHEFFETPQVQMFAALEEGSSWARDRMKELARESRDCLVAYEKQLPPMQVKPMPPELTLMELKEKVVARDQENRLLREAVSKLEERLREKDAQHAGDCHELGRLRAKLEQSDGEIVSLHQRVTSLTGEIEARAHESSDRIAAVEAEAAAGRESVKRLTAALAVAESQIEHVRSALDLDRGEEKLIVEKLAERDKELIRCNELLRERDAAITRRIQDLRRAESDLHKAEVDLEDRFREIAALSRHVLQQQEALCEAAARQNETDALLKAHIRELESMRTSRVWRMTAPLRSLIELLDRRAGGDRSEHEFVRQAIEGSGLFDRDWYLKKYEDVARSGMDPLEHYLQFGVPERRDPSADFDTDGYLLRNPDVREAGINPLLHYVVHGKEEGRVPR